MAWRRYQRWKPRWGFIATPESVQGINDGSGKYPRAMPDPWTEIVYSDSRVSCAGQFGLATDLSHQVVERISTYIGSFFAPSARACKRLARRAISSTGAKCQSRQAPVAARRRQIAE